MGTSSESLIGLLFSVFSVGVLISSPAFGALSDEIGRRVPMLLGLLGLAVSSLLFAFASSYWMLILARIFQGISAGASFVVGNALLADVYRSICRVLVRSIDC